MLNMAAMHVEAHTTARTMKGTQQTEAAAAAAAAECEWTHRGEHQNR